MDILTLNCGSSSLKYQLYRWEEKEVLASGIVERVTVGDHSSTTIRRRAERRSRRSTTAPTTGTQSS